MAVGVDGRAELALGCKRGAEIEVRRKRARIDGERAPECRCRLAISAGSRQRYAKIQLPLRCRSHVSCLAMPRSRVEAGRKQCASQVPSSTRARYRTRFLGLARERASCHAETPRLLARY